MTTIYASATDAYLRSIADDLNALQQAATSASPDEATHIWMQINALKLFDKLNTVESTALALVPATER